MENFAVYSKDKALLKAFEEKLKEKRIKRFDPWDENDNDMVYILISRNNYQYANHDGGESAARIFDLPEQWNKAVSFFEDNTKPEFKVNDWVVSGEGEIVKITSLSYMGEDDLFGVESGSPLVAISPSKIKRHATKEEIYNHLISQTDLKVGDEVIDEDGVKGIVEEISLHSERDGYSGVCLRYFREHGDHLVVAFNGWYALPINYVQKVNSVSFIIKTDKNEYIPQIENGRVSVGCVKDVSEMDLRRIRKVNEFCQEKETNLLFKRDGDIQVIVAGEVGYIGYDQINELIQKLEELEEDE
jgi:hypothetical protein